MKTNAPRQHSVYLTAILNLCAAMNRTANGLPPSVAKPAPKKSPGRVRRESRLAAATS